MGVWLSSKVTEEAHRLRDIVNSFIALEDGTEVKEVMQMEAYWALRDELVQHEQAILRAMAFDTEPTPAYTFLAEFAWLLRGGHGIVSLAWTLLNDVFCS